jgi:hypothetical protein
MKSSDIVQDNLSNALPAWQPVGSIDGRKTSLPGVAPADRLSPKNSIHCLIGTFRESIGKFRYEAANSVGVLQGSPRKQDRFQLLLEQGALISVQRAC